MNYYREHPSSERPVEIELIRAMSRRPLTKKENKVLDNYFQNAADISDAFIIKSATDWLQTTNDAAGVRLFSDFWYRGELCIMFADTNVGKSILAVQIGDSLSRGSAIEGMEHAHQAEKVLYFDFELSASQFKNRYHDGAHGDYQFGPNFARLVFNPDAKTAHKFDTYADYLNNAIENVIISSGALILIIDNITCLRSGTEAAATAISLMSKLQAIKHQYSLSILVLAHTPKRNPAKPISRNDLQGSKMLINFADSVFAIGESQTDPGLRYLKQIKQRSGTQVYGADNVRLCRIVKPSNFLHFDFTGREPEARHLLHYTEQHRRLTEERVAELNSQGLSIRAICSETGLSFGNVCRMVKRLDGGVI